jgi:hypothetical protein
MGVPDEEEYDVGGMPESPTKTGAINHVSGIYTSECHGEERTILDGQPFPRCGYCDADTVWIFERPVKPTK